MVLYTKSLNGVLVSKISVIGIQRKSKEANYIIRGRIDISSVAYDKLRLIHDKVPSEWRKSTILGLLFFYDR